MAGGMPGVMAGKGGPAKREMDSLLEEIKAKQRIQEERKELQLRQMQMPVTSQPVVGPPPPTPQEQEIMSKCLHVQDLPPGVADNALCQVFARFGVVSSAKIAKPAAPGAPSHGYVIFAARESAEKAMITLHGSELQGRKLRLEFIKSTAELQALFASSGSSKPALTSKELMCEPEPSDPPRDFTGLKTVRVKVPSDEKVRKIIERLARYVAQEGHPFEQLVMEREAPEGPFSFLYRHDSDDNLYYRWRTFAFAQRENHKRWSMDPFQMCIDGAWWFPPRCQESDRSPLIKRNTNFSSNFSLAPPAQAAAPPPPPGGAQPAQGKPADPTGRLANLSPEEQLEERDRMRQEERATQERQKGSRDRKGVSGSKRLSDDDWGQLEQVLRGLTTSKTKICQAMVWCLDHCDMAIEITECITEALTILETDVAMKRARIYVVHDVLHNTCSSKQGAWTYRREFEKALPDIFEHLFICADRMDGLIKKERFLEDVVRMLRCWEDWGVFTPQFLRGLEAALVCGVKSLQNLRARGDMSREPEWMEAKLADLRRQHFSQLEKVCRARGLRSNTAHLEASGTLTLEEVRRDWLIDRIACYELHWYQKEPLETPSRTTTKGIDDLDGEAIDDVDGEPLSESELDGEPMEQYSLSSIEDQRMSGVYASLGSPAHAKINSGDSERLVDKEPIALQAMQDGEAKAAQPTLEKSRSGSLPPAGPGAPGSLAGPGADAGSSAEERRQQKDREKELQREKEKEKEREREKAEKAERAAKAKEQRQAAIAEYEAVLQEKEKEKAAARAKEQLKEKEREKEREKEKARARDAGREKEKNKEKDKEKKSSSGREKEKESRSRSRSGHRKSEKAKKDKSSSSRSRGRGGRSRSRDRKAKKTSSRSRSRSRSLSNRKRRKTRR